MERRAALPSSSRLPSYWGPIALFFAICVSACQGAKAGSTGPSTLVIGTAIPKVKTSDGGTGTLVRSLTLEAVVGIGWDGRPVPRVFDSWESEPGLLRLHLRPSTRFHDGTTLTSAMAADIVRKKLAAQGPMVISTVSSVAAEDDSHIVIRTPKPEGLLLSDLSSLDITLPNKDEVGTGPFKSVDKGPPVLLEAFDGYRSGRPSIDFIKIVEYQTQRSAWTGLMRGDVNMLHEVSRDAAEFVEAETGFQTRSFLRTYYTGMVFNMRHPVLGRREVRQALNEAINRKQIIEAGMRNRGQAASGPVWPNHWAFSSAQRTYDYSPEMARFRLDTAGITDKRERQPGRMPSRFRFTCLLMSDDQRFDKVALLLQRQLFDVGVDMIIESAPLLTIQKRLGTGDFDAALLEFIGSRSLNWAYIFWHSPLGASGRFMNTGYKGADQALDRLRSALSDDEIRAAVTDVQRVMYEDPPALFLAWQETSRALSRDFVLPNEGPGDIIGLLPRVRPVSMQPQASR